MDPKKASRLRKALHTACIEADLVKIRASLDDLYESKDSPLGQDAEQVASPSAFAALLETALLCRILVIRHPHERSREDIAAEMEENVVALREGFGITNDMTIRAMTDAFDACRTAKAVEEGLISSTNALKKTIFEGRVRPGRHLTKFVAAPVDDA